MNTLDSLIHDIQALVECESPSQDVEAIARSAETVARVGRATLGVEPESIVIDGISHLRWRFGSANPRILLLAHHDTVWPIGSLQRRPFTHIEGILRGPGVFDMKAGIAMGFHALAEIRERERDGITLLVTGDEEIGSPSSRTLIEDEARGLEATLVLEPANEGGAFKTSRKGASIYRVQVSGRASHAGLDPYGGVNAALELAHRILAVTELGDTELDTTVTPTVATAGSSANSVPADALLMVDARAWTSAEQRRVDREILDMPTAIAGARVTVSGGVNRPPMEEAMTRGLFLRAQAVASRLGLAQPTRSAVGGASDGNFTAGIGVATLDGLGAVGGGAHAEHEYVDADQLLSRITLLRGLLEDLLSKHDTARADRG